MANGFEVRKRKSISVTLIVFLLIACVIVLCCLLFLQNHMVFTTDGIRFDFAPQRTTQALDVVHVRQPEFTPLSAPSVQIEDAILPP